MASTVAAIQPVRHRARPQASLRSKLVAYWPMSPAAAGVVPGFDLQSKLFDNRGPYDLFRHNSGERADGPSNNLPNAVDFEADSSQYLSFQNSTEPVIPNDSFWVAGWIKPESFTANRVLFSKWDSGTAQRQFAVRASTSGVVQIFVSANGTTSTTLTGPTLSAGTDYFYVLGYRRHSSTNGTLFVRINMGSETKAGHSGGIFQGSAALLIGAILSSGTAIEHWDGTQNNLLYAFGEPSQAELEWLYNDGQGRDLVRGC